MADDKPERGQAVPGTLAVHLESFPGDESWKFKSESHEVIRSTNTKHEVDGIA